MVTTAKCLVIATAAALAVGCGTAHVQVGQRDDPSPPAARTATYPAIVLYSVSWCANCVEAKTYLTERNIPYVERDVEHDQQALDTLVNRYNTKTVPLIVIGNDDEVLSGFKPEVLEKSLQRLMKH